MVQVIASHVEETGTANTTVSFSTTAATAGNRRLSAVMAVGDTCDYTAKDGSGNWENGRGIYSAANTLTRPAAVECGSNGTSPVTFSGAVTVTLTENARTIVRARGPRMCAMGDSLTAGVFGIGTGLGWMLPFSSNGIWQCVSNSAISGQASSTIAIRAYQDVYPNNPDIVTILMGTNDAASEYQTSIPASVALARACGALAVVFTTPPIGADNHGGPANTYNGGAAAVLTRNSWIRTWYSSVTDLGVILVDVSTVLDDGAGQWATASDTIDGLHWSPSGLAKVVTLALAALAPYAPLAPFMPKPAYSSNTALVSNGFFDTGSPVSGVAAGWSLTSGSVTASIVTPTASDNLGGNWQRLVVPVGTATYFTSTQVSGALTAYRGRKVRLSCRVRTSGISTSQSSAPYSGMYAQIVSNYVSQPGTIPAINANLTNQFVYTDVLISAAATDMNLLFNFQNSNSSGSVTFDIGEVLVRPLDLLSIPPALPTAYVKVQYVSSFAVPGAGQDVFASLDVGSAGANMTVTLPTMNDGTMPSGRRVVLKRVDNNTAYHVTLTGTSGQPIDGASTVTCLTNQYSSIEVIAVDYGWSIISKVGT